MELIKLVDYENTAHYLNKEYIIAIRPTNPSPTDNGKQSKIEYGSGFVDCIYMKESVNYVAGIVQGVYFR